MGNQFDARMIWNRRETWAVDEATGAAASVRDMMDRSERPWRWRLAIGDKLLDEGRSKSEQAARDAVRYRVAKLPILSAHAPSDPA